MGQRSYTVGTRVHVRLASGAEFTGTVVLPAHGTRGLDQFVTVEVAGGGTVRVRPECVIAVLAQGRAS